MVDVRKANVWDYIRFVVSAALLLFSLIVTSYSIVEQKTSFWQSVPGWAALLLFTVDLVILGIVEGLQIALVELKRCHPDSYRTSHPLAYRLGQVAARGDNVERFLMGRQVCVVVLVFFAAKLTTIHADDAHGGFLFPVPDWVQAAFLETGLLACIVVVTLAQLMPQIVAAKYPVHFLQFVIMRPAYYACVFIEMTGLTHICWLLAAAVERAARMSDDVTTANPNDFKDVESALEGVEQSLDQVSASSRSRSSESDSTDSESKPLDRKSPLSSPGKQLGGRKSSHTSGDTKIALPDADDACAMEDQISRFTQLADRVNSTVSGDTLRLLRHYLDSHPERFSQFPCVVGGRMYPSPQCLAEQIQREGHKVPGFLKPISDEDHVPPHIVACQLLVLNRQLKDEASRLNDKLQSM